MSFAVLPPEINSARLYVGAGLAPMLDAAAAWDGLADELGSAAASFSAVTAGLAGSSWLGAASTAMTGAAAQALLEQVAKTGSLQLPLAVLAEAAAEVQAKIDEQVQASAEVAQVVAALERQYDAFIDAQENRSLLTRDEDLPSGDELGAEFERFLAQQAEKKSDDDPT